MTELLDEVRLQWRAARRLIDGDETRIVKGDDIGRALVHALCLGSSTTMKSFGVSAGNMVQSVRIKLTDGSVVHVSIREMVDLVTPASWATSSTLRLAAERATRRGCSMVR
ncbi:hypothetical protein XM25_15365 [Devosia sp. H5989]|nr:hypothetical protein XM25_15365 [Devosia sp. H5989]